jgi:TolB-like protein
VKYLLSPQWRVASLRYFLAMALALAVTAQPAASAGTQALKRIVILPLAINADKDLGFLQQGLQNMLTSRLTVPQQLMPVESQKVAEALAGEPTTKTALPASRAIELARRLGADYVVIGSLTVFGDTISTDAQVFDVATGGPRVSFHEVGASQSDVIRHVDDFSAKVNQTLLGISPRTAATTPAPAAPPSAAEATNPRRHPETLLDTGPKPVPATGKPMARVQSEPWISRAFKTEIHGVAVGDVDGDGANEVVIADAHTIEVHRFTQGRLVLVTRMKETSRDTFLRVDVADINENGKAEIFVTNLAAGNDRLRSFVLEWKGNGLEPIVERQNWFYNVMRSPDGQATLYGQKKGHDISVFGISNLFDGGVYSMVWREGTYEADLRQSLPKGGNILSLTYGDAIKGSDRTILAYTRDFHLKMYDGGGNEIWSNEDYQGSRNQYIDLTDNDLTQASGEGKRIFMPHRILVADLNGNGQREVIVPYNNEQLTSFSRTKVFKNGYVQGLEWNGLNLTPVWKTEPVAKYIADVNLGDVDNDGVQDVIYAVVNKTSMSQKKQRSTLVMVRFLAAR